MALKRSNNRIIAGVCGGIAEWRGFDPAVVRLAYMVVSAFTGMIPGMIIYLILWAIMPGE